MTRIELRGVEKYFGAVQVIKDLNLTIEDNEFIVMLGQSGCGKTTTLRAIAGLETIDKGDILIDGRPVQDLKAADRDIAFVFQSFSLYPHMTVYENMAFPLRAANSGRDEVDRTVRRVADILRIGPLLPRRPSALSGGDMQRVAIGRALVRSPKAILMDEPIGALDAKLREEMRAEIKRLHLRQGSTTIYVTHDQVEAMSLADRIVIMHEGVLQQVGTPDEVYSDPANLFVAQFVGSPVMNVLDARVGDGRVRLDGSVGDGFALTPDMLGRLANAGTVGFGIRPEGVLVAHEPRDGHLAAEVGIIEPLGSHDIVEFRLGEATLRARTASGFAARPAERAWVGIDMRQAHFFDRETGNAIKVQH